MSHSNSPQPIPYASPGTIPTAPSPALPVGGGLGIVACFLGLAIFVSGCFGFEAAFIFSLLPLVLAAAGMVLTIIGALLRQGSYVDTQVLASLLVNFVGIIGALLEVSVWMHWTILPKAV